MPAPNWRQEQRANAGRKGDVFTLRLTAEERARLEQAAKLDELSRGNAWGRGALGPYVKRAALAHAAELLSARDERHAVARRRPTRAVVGQ